MDQLPVLDRERLMRVSRGNVERAREFFAALVEDSHDAYSRLRDALAVADFPGLRDRAHSLKGMALEVGAPRLAAAAAALEGETDPVSLQRCLDAVGRAIGELREALATL